MEILRSGLAIWALFTLMVDSRYTLIEILESHIQRPYKETGNLIPKLHEGSAIQQPYKARGRTFVEQHSKYIPAGSSFINIFFKQHAVIF